MIAWYMQRCLEEPALQMSLWRRAHRLPYREVVLPTPPDLVAAAMSQ